MRLKYGKGNVDIDLPKEHVIGVLHADSIAARPINDVLKASVMEPIGKDRLSSIVRKNRPGDVLIIVSDQSRSIANYSLILEFLVSELIDAGINEKNIEFLIACGTHEPHDKTINEKIYGNIARNFNIISHDCLGETKKIGTTSTGLDVFINRRACEADFVIATGKINFHYIAGFSGGPKSILPGIAAYSTIRDNHCKLRRPGVGFGEQLRNIVAQEIKEAAELFSLDYIVNVIENVKNETSNILWGDPVAAFKCGMAEFLEPRSPSTHELADCCIVSAGGYPADRDFFFGHKAVNSCLGILKPGGAIILIAQCADGFGNGKFYNYLHNNSLDVLLEYPEEKIEVGGHRAFVTAKIIKEHEIMVYSALDSASLSRLGFRVISKIDQIHPILLDKFGDKYRLNFIDNGKSVLPVYRERVDKSIHIRNIGGAKRRNLA